MPSLQRRRGLPAIIHPYKIVTDRRGSEQRVVDMSPEAEIHVVAAFIPQRGSRAELPGQMAIEVVRMIVRHGPDLANFDLWARVTYDGKQWDVVNPPEYHHGTRHTRHLSVDLRRRP